MLTHPKSERTVLSFNPTKPFPCLACFQTMRTVVARFGFSGSRLKEIFLLRNGWTSCDEKIRYIFFFYKFYILRSFQLKKIQRTIIENTWYISTYSTVFKHRYLSMFIRKEILFINSQIYKEYVFNTIHPTDSIGKRFKASGLIVINVT